MTDRCHECESLDISVAKVEQPIDILDVTLGKTVSVPCSQTVHTCGVCGFEWTDVIGEYERTEAALQYWMRRAKELHDTEESRRWAHDGNLVKQVAFVSQEPKQTGRGDPACYGCNKVWRHHNRGEVGTVCGIGKNDGVHPYGPACHVHLTAPGEG